MAEYLDERVLDGFVRLGGIAEILIGDSDGAPLVRENEPFEPVPGRVEVAGFDQRADFDGQPGIVRKRDRNRPPGRGRT